MFRKICRTCGKEFNTTEKRQLFCNKKCYYIHHKAAKEYFCKHCGKKINTSKIRRLAFCSDECRSLHNKKLFKCEVCGTEWLGKPSKTHKYCSKNCYTISQSGIEKTERIVIMCQQCGVEIRVTENKIHKYGKKFCSNKCYGESLIIKDRKSKRYLREGIDTRNWRNSVFKRDNYTCQRCKKRGGKLNAHHIIPFSVDDALIFDINNGITLCVSCHKAEHLKYSKKNNEQMSIFEIGKK